MVYQRRIGVGGCIISDPVVPTHAADDGTSFAYQISLDVEDGNPYFTRPMPEGFGISLDTDGSPYWVESGYTYIIKLDTDGNPYYTTP